MRLPLSIVWQRGRPANNCDMAKGFIAAITTEFPSVSSANLLGADEYASRVIFPITVPHIWKTMSNKFKSTHATLCAP